MGLESGEVQVWDWERASPPITLALPEAASLTQVCWSPSGETLAVCEQDRVSLWRPPAAEIATRQQLPGRLAAAIWEGDGSALALALVVGSPPTQRLALVRWDPESGRLDSIHEDPVSEGRSRYGFSSDRRWMVPSRNDGRLEIWDLRSLRRVGSVRTVHRQLDAVAVSADESTLAVSRGGEVDLWHAMSGERLPPLGRDEAAIYSLTFSPGGELLAGKSRQGSICLWSCRNWSERRAIPEPSFRGQSPEIAFHPAKPWLATYDRRNTAIRVWMLRPEEIPPMVPTLRKILFLSAEPKGVQPLKTGEELREIREKLRLGSHWDRFEVHDRTAVRAEDIQGALQELTPEIVHFAGHGRSAGALIEGPRGEASTISSRALTNLLALFAESLKCVVLNVCHSADQAGAISRVVESVIGMSSSIQDPSAIAFSTGFYQALGNGVPIASAYRFGCSLIDVKGLPGYNLPVLYRQGKIEPLEPPGFALAPRLNVTSPL